MSATVTLSSFADLAKWAGSKGGKSKGKLAVLPESSFSHVLGLAGKPAAAIWFALNDKAANKKSGPEGSPFVSVWELADETGFEEDTIVAGVIRLAKSGLISKITPAGLIAA